MNVIASRLGIITPKAAWSDRPTGHLSREDGTQRWLGFVLVLLSSAVSLALIQVGWEFFTA